MLANLQKNIFIVFLPILIVFVISAIACTGSGKYVKNDEAAKYFNLGITYWKLGKYQEAVGAFKHAIRIKPDFAWAHFNLGQAYLLSDNKDSALKEYKILKDLDKEKANELYNLIYP